MTVANTHVGVRGRPQSDSTYGEITQFFLVYYQMQNYYVLAVEVAREG
jgi:hypothetical protein